MTEINGNELLAFVDEAVANSNGDGWSALFELNDLVTDEEEYRAVLAA
jgi:hypothetical protein